LNSASLLLFVQSVFDPGKGAPPAIKPRPQPPGPSPTSFRARIYSIAQPRYQVKNRVTKNNSDFSHFPKFVKHALNARIFSASPHAALIFSILAWHIIAFFME
jgi:hypothetical protein